jgi:arsenical pump membrane protein
VTSEVAQLAGVSDVAAHALAPRARHRVVLLWLTLATLAIR